MCFNRNKSKYYSFFFERLLDGKLSASFFRMFLARFFPNSGESRLKSESVWLSENVFEESFVVVLIVDESFDRNVITDNELEFSEFFPPSLCSL